MRAGRAEAVAATVVTVTGVVLLGAVASPAFAQRQMESLGRGLVVIPQGGGKVFVGWRLLGTDPEDIGFNLYRSTGDRAPVKLNPEPLMNGTNFVGSGANSKETVSYFVRPVQDGQERETSAPFCLPANAPIRPYISVPLQTLPGHTPNDASVGDLDGDGEYEIIDPDRPGLEVFDIHERPRHPNGAEFRDARTGDLIWGKPSPDVGRGVALDIDPRHRGYEMWASGQGLTGLWNVKGERVSDHKPRSCNFGVWWDGDLLREILDGNRITKWNWQESSETRLVTAESCDSNNSTKSTPCLCADILGDWREEVIWRTTDGKELRIYTTTIPTEHRLYTLMHDPIYRLSVAYQNVGYNQPTQTGFCLGDGMSPPPRPAIVTRNWGRGP